MKIAVGISGGVDSAVAAYLLKNQGHDVVGAIMKIWDKSATANSSKGNACYGPDEEHDIADAQRVCDFIGIPLYVIDCSQQYKQIVLTNFKQEYHAGRTPNPCVLCNQNIKFGVLPSLLADSGVAFERFATGHYARVEWNESTRSRALKKAKDETKDQTYFLYRLTMNQISKALFPIGDYTKKEVREIARSTGLPVHDKGDSQDFYCGDYTELLDMSGNNAGNIVDIHGRTLGTHSGICNYTVGQRKGLGLSHPQPLYVVAIDAEKNEIIVGEKMDCFSIGCIAGHINTLLDHLPSRGTAKIRSNSKENPCSFSLVNDTLHVIFDTPQSAITPGQSVVLYDHDTVCGGGIIEDVLPDNATHQRRLNNY